MESLPSTTCAAFEGQRVSTIHTLQPRQSSALKTGARRPSMPKSFSEGFMQLFGQPPMPILNLWGSFTFAQPT